MPHPHRFKYSRHMPHKPIHPDQPIIYVDLDGVIFDFEKAVVNHLPHFASLKELNAHEQHDKVLRNMYINSQQFFAHLELTNFAHALIDIVHNFGFEWRFLSAVGQVHPQPAEVIQQKTTALANVDPSWGHRLITVPDSHYKCFYARPQAFLIDDFKRNIDQWKAHGGIGCEVSRQHHLPKLFDKLSKFAIAHGADQQQLDHAYNIYLGLSD